LIFLQLVSAGPIAHRSSSLPGIVYSPYTGSNGNSRCKTAQEITSDITRIHSQGKYGYIRLYDRDCDQVKNVLPLAQKYGMQVMLGLWNLDDMATSVNLLCQDVGNNWGSVHSVTVGNEFVFGGKYTVAQMLAFTKDAKAKLKAKGYSGWVASVNIFYEVLDNPSLCDQDFIPVNCHAFFDGGIAADGVGKFLKDMSQQVITKCPGKTVLITESGWPHQGTPNGKAVPSRQNQQTALASIARDYGSALVYFTAFDDTWKAPGANNAEQFWGII